MSHSTQYDRVLAVMLERDEVCGSDLYGMYIPRFGAHLHRMKEAGYVWSKRPCDRHNHEGTGWLYRLEAMPTPPEKERVPTGDRDSQLSLQTTPSIPFPGSIRKDYRHDQL